MTTDITYCRIPCSRSPDCLRSGVAPKGGTASFAHFLGGPNCPGFLAKDNHQCSNCTYWKRDDPPSGRMPGVTDKHRQCGRPRSAGARTWKEFRHPSDWCDQWKGQK